VPPSRLGLLPREGLFTTLLQSMMFRSLCLTTAFFSTSTVGALILQRPGVQNATDRLNPAIDFTALGAAASTNITLPLNASSNEWDFHCDGATYGRNLNIDSCLQAFRSMSVLTKQKIYRDRADPHPKDNRLPQMIISGECP